MEWPGASFKHTASVEGRAITRRSLQVMPCTSKDATGRTPVAGVPAEFSVVIGSESL